MSLRLAVLVSLTVFAWSGAAGAVPNVSVTNNQNQTLSSDKTIKRFSLGDIPQQNSRRYFGLSDEGLYARKTWDTYVYGAQGSLIAKKLLAFGTTSDLRYVRNSLVVAPVQQSSGFGGIVDSTPGVLGHLGEKYSIESNAELVIMARDYLLHSGDTASFRAPTSRVTCYRRHNGGLVSVHRQYWQGFDCNGSPSQNQAAAFVERTHAGYTAGTGLVNPARGLGQLFTSHENFVSLRFGVQMTQSPAEPVRLIVRDNSSSVTRLDKTIQCPSSDPLVTCPSVGDGWLEVSFGSTFPPGNYNVEILPLTSNRTQDSYWYSLGWWGEVDAGTWGGATTKIYPQTTDPNTVAAKSWSMAEKIEFAMNWALSQSWRNNAFGIFISPFAMNRGTTETSSRSSTYYDNFKSGYKDSYVNALYLKAMVAYAELNQAGLVRSQFAPADIASVAQDITGQLSANTGGNGALMSWIDAQGNNRWLGLLVPHAIAATLPMTQPTQIQNVYDTLRNQSRIKSGYFRTNVIPVEQTSPLFWDAHRTWSSTTTVNGISGFASWVSNQTGDWHIFGNGIGNGNFGLQENNGGVLLSTTGFTFAAGPYPEMFQDYKGLVTSLDRIGDAVVAGTFNAYADPDARKPITNAQVFTFCSNARPGLGQSLDYQSAMFCGFYKDITYNLPEGGVFPSAFVEGLLRLKVAPNGSVTFYGQPLDATNRTATITSRFPPEITAVTVTDYNVFGVPRTILCTRSGSQLTCRMP
jgi:hypothetical protein